MSMKYLHQIPISLRRQPVKYLCQYGNCQEEMDAKDMITVTDNRRKYTARFCGWEHAGAYCLGATPIAGHEIAQRVANTTAEEDK